MPESERMVVFGNGAYPISVVFENTSSHDTEEILQCRLFHATSSTLAPCGPAIPWKTKRILAGQRLLDAIEVALPAVKAVCQFQLRWYDVSGKRVGITPLLVCPTNMLARLKTLVGEGAIGMLDTTEKWPSIFISAGLNIQCLSSLDDIKEFEGRLLLIRSINEPTARLLEIKTALGSSLQAGAAIWILPGLSETFHERLLLLTVMENKRRVVAISAGAIPDISTSAKSQLRIFELVQTALSPDPLDTIIKTVP